MDDNNNSGNSNRGLANADEETRSRVAHEGGEARAQDEDIKSGELGRKGGQARAQDEDVKSGELGKQGAEARLNKDDDQD